MLYLVGQDQNNKMWNILKIDRSKPTELIIAMEPHPYTAVDCVDRLRKIQEENKETGGLKLVTNCYGIIGFVKFHGPYYMLVITGRSKIGTILGHDVYYVDKSEIIKIPPGLPEVANPEDEKRLLEGLRSMDLSKGFFFSYTYNLAQNLQYNITEKNTLESLNNTTFVWNESMKTNFRSPIWTVSLVHGFFIQKKVSVSEKDFQLTLISRRSRHFAGRRYLKRGVNEEGMVANDVETEQIVFEEAEDGIPPQITSVVQRRGSIPLPWQETSKCLTLSKRDESYNATRLHFENLKTTYAGQIIVLNLIKSFEKKPHESLLRFAFEQAIHHINKKCLSMDDPILFVHMDVKDYSRSHEVLPVLISIGSEASTRTNILHCQQTPISNSKDNNSGQCDFNNSASSSNAKDPHFTTVSIQKGVLRTNCRDCLDRTNGAQFAYGLASLSRQLRALGLLAESDEISINDDLSHILMDLYEQMGDALSMQYTGSAALHKMFWKHRGKCCVVRQVQEYFRSTQRYFINLLMDRKKQDAIDIFLGYFHPQQEPRSMVSLGSSNICGNKETQDNEEHERPFNKTSSGCIIPWKAGSSYAGDAKLHQTVMEPEEAMNKSLNVNQEQPICQSSSSVNTSTTQGTLLLAEVQNHLSPPERLKLFYSNFLGLDEESNAVKNFESVSLGVTCAAAGRG